MIDHAERKALIADLRNQTELGRLNEDVIAAGFAKIEELGYVITKKEPPPVEVQKPMLETKPEPKPDPMPAPKPSFAPDADHKLHVPKRPTTHK